MAAATRITAVGPTGVRPQRTRPKLVHRRRYEGDWGDLRFDVDLRSSPRRIFKQRLADAGHPRQIEAAVCMCSRSWR